MGNDEYEADQLILESEDDDEGVEEGSSEEEGSQSEDEVDDGEGWITPANLKKAVRRAKMEAAGKPSDASRLPIEVACVTTDFAMQNVLIQMGLPLVSVDGMRIHRARTSQRRCIACYQTTDDMHSAFCPTCGHRGTLKRVGVTLQSDGTKVVHVNFKRTLDRKGARYSRKLPQSGKHAMNELTSRDTKLPSQRPSRKALARTQPLADGYLQADSPFAEHDVSSRAFVKGYRRNGPVQSMAPFGRWLGPTKNPNEPKTSTSKRKKKMGGQR